MEESVYEQRGGTEIYICFNMYLKIKWYKTVTKYTKIKPWQVYIPTKQSIFREERVYKQVCRDIYINMCYYVLEIQNSTEQ